MAQHSRLIVLVVMAGVSLSAGAAGCAQKRLQAEPEVPPLAEPGPPPRVLPPLEGGPIEGALPASVDTAPRPRPASRPRGQSRPADATRTDPARPDAAAQAAAPEEPGAAEPAPPGLQLVPSGAEAARIESEIRQQIVRASQDLNRVDYRALNADARTQYDTAKRYLTLADQAIVERNLIFARTLADKAGAIAVVLLRR